MHPSTFYSRLENTMTTIKKVLLTAALLLAPTPALAQSDTTTAPTTSGSTDTTGTAGSTGTTGTTDTTNDRGFDYGWLGLLGLLGLAGLRRPAPHVVHTDRSTTQRP